MFGLSDKEKIENFYSNLDDSNAPDNSQKRSLVTPSLISALNEFKIDSNFVLDLGGGFGINSVYLSKLGYNVDILDKSEMINKFIKNIRSINLTYGWNLKINTIINNNFNKSNLNKKYDLILSSAFLHVLKSEEIQREMILKIKSITKLNGINIYTNFISDNGLIPQNKNIISLIKSYDMLKYYQNENWKVKSYFNPKNRNNFILIAQRIK